MSSNLPYLVTAFRSGNEKGSVLVFEKQNLPFKPQRMFWITDVPRLTKRGGHAHKECSQFIVCVNGTISIDVYGMQDKIILDESSLVGLQVPPMNWIDLRFLRSKSKIVVLCSHEYNESEYIRDFNEFKRILENPV
jgi:hypothetical protein